MAIYAVQPRGFIYCIISYHITLSTTVLSTYRTVSIFCIFFQKIIPIALIAQTHKRYCIINYIDIQHKYILVNALI